MAAPRKARRRRTVRVGANAGYEVKVSLEGVYVVLKKLEDIDKKVRRKVLRAAVTKTARLIARDTKAAIPRRTGKTRKVVAVQTQFRDGQAIGKIGAKKGSHMTRVFHLVEFGTGLRVQRKSGRRTGRMPAHPSLRPALEKNGPKFGAILQDEFHRTVR